MRANAAFSILATLGVASAHTIMQAVGVNGKAYGQGVGIYMPSDDSYISDVKSDSLACNGAPVTGFTASSEVIPVKAGDVVTGSWLHTLTSTGPDSEADNKVLASSHKGPVNAFLKKVSDATQNPAAGPGDGWFKIFEQGLISSTEWGVDALLAAGGVQSVTIPSCIEDGDYLLRFEIIALHSASVAGGAQFYMECAQLSVSGGSGAASPPTYAIPGIYSADDPGILVNIYNGQGQPYPSSYTIPGPGIFTCDAASANNSVTSSAEVAPVSTTSISAISISTIETTPIATSAIETSAIETSAVEACTAQTSATVVSAIETSAAVISVPTSSAAPVSDYGNSTVSATDAPRPTFSSGTGISGPSNATAAYNPTSCSGQTVSVHVASTGTMTSRPHHSHYHRYRKHKTQG